MTDQLKLPFTHAVHNAFESPQGNLALVERTHYADKWVTYRYDDKGNCFWGHYMRTYDSAHNDYIARMKRLES